MSGRIIQVLLVEDNPTDALIVQELLKQPTNVSYEITCVQRLDQAVQLLEVRSFQVALLDLGLPDCEGLATFLSLQSARPDLPVIVLTALGDESVVFKAVQAGAQDYLMKGQLNGPWLTSAIRHATERKRYIAALQQAHQQLRQLLDYSPAVIYALKLEGEKITPRLVSENIFHLLGFQVSEANRYDWWQGQLHSADRERAVASFAETLTQGQSQTDYRLRHKDGSYRWVTDHRRLIRDSAGRPTEFFGIFTDITKRKTAEAETYEKQAFFEALANVSLSGIMVINSAGRKIFQNQRAAELLQIPPGIAADPDDQRQLANVVSRMKNPVQFAEQVRHLNAHPELTSRDEIELLNGNVLDRYSSPVLTPDGTNYGRIWTFHDITERKQTEKTIRDSEERFRQVVESIREVFWIVDVEQNCAIYVSPSYQEIWGRSPDELYASRDHFVETIHPDDREGYLQAVRDKYLVGGFDETYRIVRPDGSLRWIRSKAFPVRNDAGKVYRTVGISEDITEQRSLEEQSLRTQRLESLGMLAAGISHDLNNVLAPIGMAATLLRKHLSESGDLRLLDTLEKCADRGAALVRQILGFVHGIDTKPSLVQVKHLLRDVTAIVTGTFPKSITLNDEVANDLWPILANSTQIHQVLINLCVNARDAMPQGGTLTVRAENCALDAAAASAIEGALPGAWLVLHIGDTGTGIPPAVLPRVWEPFFTTKSPGKGTGLGLANVRGIVEACHGFLTLQTEVDRGTIIRIYLPAQETAASGSTAPFTGSACLGHGELILLVDDEELIRETAKATLSGAGYRVIVATDGFEATVAFEAHAAEIALIITDLDMPKVSGETLAHVIHTFRPTVKILAMSGAGSGSKKPDIPTFATAYMPKPFTADILLNQVRKLLTPAT